MSAVMDRKVETFAKNTYEIPEELDIVDKVPTECLSDYELQEALAGLSKEELELGASMFRNCQGKSKFGSFRIMSPKDGDKRVTWRRTVIKEIRAAKQMFMDLIKQGMVPYAVGANGKAATEMKEFDPLAEEIIFMPLRAIAGG